MSLIRTFVSYAYILAKCNTVLFKLASIFMQVEFNVLKPSEASDDNWKKNQTCVSSL